MDGQTTTANNKSWSAYNSMVDSFQEHNQIRLCQRFRCFPKMFVFHEQKFKRKKNKTKIVKSYEMQNCQRKVLPDSFELTFGFPRMVGQPRKYTYYEKSVVCNKIRLSTVRAQHHFASSS